MKINAPIFAILAVGVSAMPQDSPERKTKLDGIRNEGLDLVAKAVGTLDLNNLSLDEQKLKLSRAQINFIKEEIKKKIDFDESSRLRISSTITCFLRNIFEITKEAPLKCAPEKAPKVENKRVVTDDIVLKVRDITTPLIETDIKNCRDIIFERKAENFDEANKKAVDIMDKSLQKLDEIEKLLGLDKKDGKKDVKGGDNGKPEDKK